MAQKSTGFTQENPEKGKWVLWFPVGYEVFIRGLEEMDKITIAIAEDQEYTRETLARIVESQEDFALVGTAQNGEEALHLLRQHNPQILLLDMLMPLVDGKEVMHQLRTNDTISPGTKVIVVTAADKRELAAEMFAMGAIYYIVKPFDDQTIIQSIRTALDQEILSYDTGRESTKTDTPKKPLEHRITELMLLLGVPAHLRGYQYLREAIFIVATLPDTRHQVAKVVYERIAGEHGVTASTVERAVRHAIETAWDRGDMDTMDQIFGYTVQASKGRPTNTEYIAAVADYLKLTERV